MSGILDVRQSGGSDTNSQLLKLISNPFQSEIQLDAFWASLGTSFGITVLLATVFSLLRPRHTLVYAPKTKHADARHAPPPIGKGPLSWIGPVIKTKEDVLVEKIGMDAVFFLRFTRMLRNIFCVLGVVGIAIMIPVNVTLSADGAVDRKNGFTVMTPLAVFGKGLWAQVVLAYFLDIIVAGFLYMNYRQFYQLRRRYFESPEYQQSLHARSIMIRDIPSNLRSDEGILKIADEINATGALPRAAIARNVRQLPELIEEHEEAVRKLESVLAKYLKNPDRLPPNRPMIKPLKGHKGRTSGGRVDAIDYLTDYIKKLEQQICDARERVDKRDAAPYGFASWEQITEAHTAAFTATKKSTHGAKIALAPRPSELIWKNLTLSKSARVRKRWLNAVWITILTILWTPINAGIAIFLSNLSNLGSVWPGFQASLSAHRGWWALVQGIAAPAITSTVYLVLPIIFRRLQIRAGDVSKTSRERHVIRNLFNFFTFNNLIIFSLFSAVWQYVTAVIQDSKNQSVWDALKSGNFFLTVTTSLCQISPFWVNWILQRNLGAAIDLAQLWTLFYVWFAKTFMAPTPRQRIEWTAPQAFDYASYYNYFLFYTTVALCFATLQPIVLVVAALYFVLDSVLKKYLLMYVFVTKNESGGQFWRVLFNRIVFAVILSNIIIGVVVKARGTWGMVFALIPPVILMILFKFFCAKQFDAGMHYYHRSGMKDSERINPAASSKAITRASHKFRHPVLEKPLITPMVSEKAKHVLASIYSGRLGSDVGHNYSDIAMEPMTQSGKPQQDAPFELVPEAQQDFMYYKNRSDFREEGGDIYGRQEDLISERSGTPMSFMTGQGHNRSQTPVQHDGIAPFTDSPEYHAQQPNYKPYTPSPPSTATHAPIPRRPIPSNMSSPMRGGTPTRGYEQVRQTGEREDGDLSLRHGPYTDPNDDQMNLLRGGPDIRTPTGEFMSVDRWQTQTPGMGSMTGTPKYEDGGSYDYFRGPGRR